MPTRHYVVHPEYAIQSPYKDSVEKYTAQICDLVKNQDTYIVSAEASPRPYTAFQEEMLFKLHGDFLVESDKILPSNGFFSGGEFFPFGHIKNTSWLSHIATMNPDDDIRIHGCFYGDGCTRNLALQLYGYLQKQQHWYNWDVAPSSITAIGENVRDGIIELSQQMKRFNKIKYGIVYSNKSIERKETSHIIPRFLSKSTLDEQLTDNNTSIFG